MRLFPICMAGPTTMMALLAQPMAEQARAIQLRPAGRSVVKSARRGRPVRLEAWKTDGVVLLHTFDQREMVDYHEIAEGADQRLDTLAGLSLSVANTYYGFRLMTRSLRLVDRRPALALVEARVADDEPLEIVEYHRTAERWVTRDDVVKVLEQSAAPNARGLTTMVRHLGYDHLTLARDGIEVSRFGGAVALTFRPARDYLLVTSPGPVWRGYRYTVEDVTSASE